MISRTDFLRACKRARREQPEFAYGGMGLGLGLGLSHLQGRAGGSLPAPSWGTDLPSLEAIMGIPFRWGAFLFVVGGAAPITFTLAPGDHLASGLSLSSDGVISGAATQSGAGSTGIVATDAQGRSATVSLVWTIEADSTDFAVGALDIYTAHKPYLDYFNAVAARSTWDTDIAVTTRAEFTTAINNLKTDPKAAQHHRIRLRWNGEITTTTTGADYFLIYGGNNTEYDAPNNHRYYDFYGQGGSLTIEPDAGYDPRIKGTHFEIQAASGILIRNMTMNRRVGDDGLSQVSAHQFWIQNGSTRDRVEAVVMFDNMRFGALHAYPASDMSAFPCAITSQRRVGFVGVRNSTFFGCYDAMRGPVRNLYSRNNDYRMILNDAGNNFGHTSALGWSASDTIRVWREANTYRDRQIAAPYNTAHSDAMQIGNPGDVALTMRTFAQCNVMHHSHAVAGGGSETGGGTQDDWCSTMGGDVARFAQRNITAITAINGFVVSTTGATGANSISRKNTMVRAGTVPSSEDTSANSPRIGEAGASNSITIVAEDNISASYVPPAAGKYPENAAYSATNCAVVDFRASHVASSDRPELLFVNASAFVRDGSNKISYTVPNETGTREQFVAGMWSIFKPSASYAGQGCPDPRPWIF